MIPPSVKVIDEGAFRNFSQLTNVELHEGLEEIGKGAFFECMSLQAIVIPLSVKVIDEGAFRNFSQLMNVELPEGLEEIGKGAFLNARHCMPSSSPDLSKSLIRMHSAVARS